jgi:hypothetical protein
MTRGWITIRDAAPLMGVSRRQARRRLERLNAVHPYAGKLLRWRGDEGGVREVNLAVLRQIVESEPVDIERSLSEVHDRVDVLDRRTKAHRRELVAQRKAIEGLQMSQSGLNSSVAALLGTRGMTNRGPSGDTLGQKVQRG